MENFWHLGKWRGIPVSLHWTVLLWIPWLYLFMRDLVAAFFASIAFFILLVSHEAGHVIAARRRNVYVERINFFGLHGETMRATARKEGDEIFIAWAGVLAQLVILALAMAGIYLVADIREPWFWMAAAPMYDVFTKWNLFLVIVALLPIGPMDGHTAWRLIPYLRRGRKRRAVPPAPPPDPLEKMAPAERRAFEEESEKIAAELIDRIGKK